MHVDGFVKVNSRNCLFSRHQHLQNIVLSVLPFCLLEQIAFVICVVTKLFLSFRVCNMAGLETISALVGVLGKRAQR